MAPGHRPRHGPAPAAIRLFETVLPGRGSLAPHVELLTMELRDRDEPWPAGECDDLFLAEPDTFPFRLRRILRWLQDPRHEDQVEHQRRSTLRDLTTIEKIKFVRAHVSAPIHAVRTALQDGDDAPRFVALIGGQYDQPFP